jgi:hypothetical protein
MAHSTTYYTLVGSLPALPRHFEEAERVPISKLGLTERLRMLQPSDAATVEAMTDFLAWERQPLERTDEDVVKRFNQFVAAVDDQFAQDLIRHVVNVRSIIAAIRCRRLKLDPPVGVEPVASHIVRNWNHPDFRLGNKYPWIGEVDAQLNSEAPFDLERTILNIGWRYAKRLADQFHFTFEAVVLYLIRWEMVYRWTQRNAAAGQEKFEQLVSEAMGEHVEMFTG